MNRIFTHHTPILEVNGESFRLNQSKPRAQEMHLTLIGSPPPSGNRARATPSPRFLTPPRQGIAQSLRVPGPLRAGGTVLRRRSGRGLTAGVRDEDALVGSRWPWQFLLQPATPLPPPPPRNSSCFGGWVPVGVFGLGCVSAVPWLLSRAPRCASGTRDSVSVRFGCCGSSKLTVPSSRARSSAARKPSDGRARRVPRSADAARRPFWISWESPGMWAAPSRARCTVVSARRTMWT